MSSISARIPTVQYGFLTVEGAHPGELLDMLRHESLEDVIEELRLLDAEQNAKNGLPVASSQREDPWGNQAPPQDQPQQQQQAPASSYGRSKQEANVREGSNDGPPTCDHGKARKWVQKDTGGRGGNGFKAWMCDATRDRDDQCKPIFVD